MALPQLIDPHSDEQTRPLAGLWHNLSAPLTDAMIQSLQALLLGGASLAQDPLHSGCHRRHDRLYDRIRWQRFFDISDS
jgi:hypothetical protein